MKDFAVIICAFVKERLEQFIPNFESKSLGIDADIYFIHNAFEPIDIKNRYVRSQNDIDSVRKLIQLCNINNKILIERNNIGEDLGAYRFAWTKLRHNYKYMFFLNEAATIHQNNWLLRFYNMYESNNKIVGATPQICPGIRYKYCMPTTYWSMRCSFGDLLEWPEPRSRADSELQEMELVWPQAQKHGFYLAQVGNGGIIEYKVQTFNKEGLY